jgi:hypothetical protein
VLVVVVVLLLLSVLSSAASAWWWCCDRCGSVVVSVDCWGCNVVGVVCNVVGIVVGCGWAVVGVAVVGWVWVSGLVCVLVVAMRGVAAVVGVYECVRWCAVAVGAWWSSIFIPLYLQYLLLHLCCRIF